jgi:hypothetical protein
MANTSALTGIERSEMGAGQRDDRRYLAGRENRDRPAASLIYFQFEKVAGDAQQAAIVGSLAARPHFAKLAAVRGDF